MRAGRSASRSHEEPSAKTAPPVASAATTATRAARIASTRPTRRRAADGDGAAGGAPDALGRRYGGVAGPTQQGYRPSAARQGAATTVCDASRRAGARSRTVPALRPRSSSAASRSGRSPSTTVVAREHLDLDSGDRDGTARDSTISARSIDVWARWDSDWFLRIAEARLRLAVRDARLLPAVSRCDRSPVGRLLGGHYVLGGRRSSRCRPGRRPSFVLLTASRSDLLDELAASRRTVVLLAVFPTSFFLGAVYSESLFLAPRGRHVPARRAGQARLGGARRRARTADAIAGRSRCCPRSRCSRWEGERRLRVVGVVLVPRRDLRGLPRRARVSIGRPLAFVDAQETSGIDGSARSDRSAGPVRRSRTGDVLELALSRCDAPARGGRLAAARGRVRCLRLGALVIPMSFPSDRLGGLYSFPRFAIVAFPCFVALATSGCRQRGALRGTSRSATTRGVLVIRWALWEWVA